MTTSIFGKYSFVGILKSRWGWRLVLYSCLSLGGVSGASIWSNIKQIATLANLQENSRNNQRFSRLNGFSVRGLVANTSSPDWYGDRMTARLRDKNLLEEKGRFAVTITISPKRVCSICPCVCTWQRRL